MTVITKFTVGVGNNLFQYFYGKLLSEKINTTHIHPYFPLLNIKGNNKGIFNSFMANKIKHDHYKFLCNAKEGKKYVVEGGDVWLSREDSDNFFLVG